MTQVESFKLLITILKWLADAIKQEQGINKTQQLLVVRSLKDAISVLLKIVSTLDS